MKFQWFSTPKPLPISQRWFDGELGKITISCDPICVDSLNQNAYCALSGDRTFPDPRQERDNMSKTFSVRSNAVRNARISLGKGAQQGVHFTIGGEKGAHTWSAIAGAAPAALPVSTAHNADLAAVAGGDDAVINGADNTAAIIKKVKAKTAARRPAKKVVKRTGRKAGRKQITSVSAVSGKRLKMFKLISSAKGASLDTLTKALKWQKHTVRGAVSTIASQFKVKVKSFRDERRGRVYQVAGRHVAAV